MKKIVIPSVVLLIIIAALSAWFFLIPSETESKFELCKQETLSKLKSPSSAKFGIYTFRDANAIEKERADNLAESEADVAEFAKKEKSVADDLKRWKNAGLEKNVKARNLQTELQSLESRAKIAKILLKARVAETESISKKKLTMEEFTYELDADNSFGTALRSSWKCKLVYKDKTFDSVSATTLPRP